MRLALALWVAGNFALGAWIARDPLTQAATAVSSTAHLAALFLRLKLQGAL